MDMKGLTGLTHSGLTSGQARLEVLVDVRSAKVYRLSTLCGDFCQVLKT